MGGDICVRVCVSFCREENNLEEEDVMCLCVYTNCVCVYPVCECDGFVSSCVYFGLCIEEEDETVCCVCIL